VFESYRDCDEGFMMNVISSFGPSDLVLVGHAESFENVTRNTTMHLGKTVSMYGTVTT
jgi:hypothetical protein